MEIKAGLSALVTGGASGIGKAICLALAEKGVFVTVVDFSNDGKEVAALVEELNAKIHSDLKFPAALFIRCDITDSGLLSSAFKKHLDTYGSLDICINNAGIANALAFSKALQDDSHSWRHVMDVNLMSVIDCTRLAIQIMKEIKKPGVIINVGSAAGLYPSFGDPIYAASKGGVVLFSRSLFLYRREGIRINVLCPEFVETDLAVKAASRQFVELMGGYIPMQMVVKGAFELITDESKAGSCLWITKRKGLQYWPSPMEEAKYRLPSLKTKRELLSALPVNVEIPQSYEKIVVHTLSHNFRDATRMVHAPLKLPIKSNNVLVKVMYAGVNASDVNFSSGRYFQGKDADLGNRLPFDAGFEAVGIIAAVGDSVKGLKVGTPAAIMTFGSYAEFMMVPSKYILPVAKPEPEVVAMLTSGLTASIALDQVTQMDSGKVVLVTAAAGGTGQFAVQLAKLTGNKVLATCGGKEKAALLKKLGVDRVIDYKNEDIKTVLKTEFPDGVDIIYESVGGQMFDLCLNAMSVHGRMIVIGMISQYGGESGWKPLNYPGLCEKLLSKSQTLAGFFLVQYSHLWRQHLDKLYHLFSIGMLKVHIDPKRFVGLHSVVDAVEYLHSGKSIGKVVVCIDPSSSREVARL